MIATAPKPLGPDVVRSLWLYAVGWGLAGVVAATVVVWWPWTSTVAAPWPLVLALLALTVVSDMVSLDLHAGAGGVSLSLLEASVVVSLLLLPPPVAVIVVITGVMLRHGLRRLPALKLLFNFGQHAAAVSLAAALLGVLAPAPGVDARRVVAVMLALLVYSLTNTLALAGVFSRLGETAALEQLTRRPVFLVSTTLGNASVGVIGVAMWTAFPSIVWVVAAPALALYLSYASVFRIERLLGEAREERDRLDSVVEGVQEGIVLLDPSGTIQLWNPGMSRITGIPTADALGRPATEVLQGTTLDDQPLDPLLGVHAPTDEPPVVEATLSHTDGPPRPVRMVHGPLRDDRGHVLGDVIVVVDLTREREAAALKEDFVARVSHELRTPLSPLRGYAQILLASGDRVTREQREEFLESMLACVEHLNRLVDDLLLVARIGAGAADPTGVVEPRDLDMVDLVSRLVDWTEREHPDRSLHLEVAEGTVVAWADPLRTGQVVTNLLSNACRYALPDRPIRVHVASDGAEVRVRVIDEGPGIPEDKLETIFERFQRLDDPQRMRTRGLGLGLFIARQLAEAMGGNLAVASREGHGSTFTLTLPVGDPAAVTRDTVLPLAMGS